LVDFHEGWYGGNAIQGDLDAIFFNPIASIILKVLRFKFLRCALLNCAFVLFEEQYYCLCSMVTIATKVFTAVNSVKLSYIEFNEVTVSSLKLSFIKLGSNTANK
jgi:hypothetical protein